MERIEFVFEGVTFERVSKRVARRLYNSGDCKIAISGRRQREVDMCTRSRDFSDLGDTFDNWVDAWCYFNECYYGYPRFFIAKV